MIWASDIVVEVPLTAAFGGLLLYFHRELDGARATGLCAAWAARAAASVYALRTFPEHQASVGAALQALLGVAVLALMFAFESQSRRLRRTAASLQRLREGVDGSGADPLTGLLSRAALMQWLEAQEAFVGRVAFCDLDDFKALNDRYGHLVGDEVLHGVGQLIRASIRQEDRAFRWGGDEIVIFFRTEDADLVETRLRAVLDRLKGFQIRSCGPMAVGFSWGTASTAGRTLVEAIEEADGRMYERKRVRQAGKAHP